MLTQPSLPFSNETGFQSIRGLLNVASMNVPSADVQGISG